MATRTGLAGMLDGASKATSCSPVACSTDLSWKLAGTYIEKYLLFTRRVSLGWPLRGVTATPGGSVGTIRCSLGSRLRVSFEPELQAVVSKSTPISSAVTGAHDLVAETLPTMKLLMRKVSGP
jgi:hypothetical protein